MTEREAPDYDDWDEDCANCGGEGFTYGCSWDWQCETYDEGEGTCLCTRRCDWCNPPKPTPAQKAALLDCTPWDVEVGVGPAIAFCANGLLQESTIIDDGVELSPLGLAVRKVLERSNDTD